MQINITIIINTIPRYREVFHILQQKYAHPTFKYIGEFLTFQSFFYKSMGNKLFTLASKAVHIIKPFPERRAIARAHLRTRLRTPRRAMSRTPRQRKYVVRVMHGM